MLTPTYISSMLKDDLQTFANRASLKTQADVLWAHVKHYRVNKLNVHDRILEQIVSFYISKPEWRKIKGNAEKFVIDNNVQEISLETISASKESVNAQLRQNSLVDGILTIY